MIYLPVALAIGLGLTIVYFSLAKFLAANSRALDRTHKNAEETPEQRERTQLRPITGAASQKIECKATAKAGK
jgi:hypothetical protein